MDGAGFYQAALVLIPLLLVLLAVEEETKSIRMAKVRSHRADALILIGSAVILGALILSAVIAMGALLRR